ncbi:MAG: multicopper oxidase family protein [Rhodospirillales bacterium]|nr:multicopper oxidase family protein [Rhodospirillales bacterium]
MRMRRRDLLLSAGSAVLLPLLGRARQAEASETAVSLEAAPGRVQLVGRSYPATDVWCYGGQVPGPGLRLRQGERLRVEFANGLVEATTVHWHGLRIPNGMDGVPYLTQEPVAPGGRFVYEFDPPDAGTYWYHPHQRSSEQVGRGLYGPLIVEEREPPRVDRELVWMLDDWRMTPEAALVDDFDNFHDMSHGGRLGNTVTVNGVIAESEPVRAGERIRLRLINTANARFFSLGFTDHKPVVIAIDGQPCEPHEPIGGRVVLGPAMRVDLMLDMSGRPGQTFPVIDDFYRNSTYRLLDLAYDAGPPLREHALDAPLALPANPLPAPDLASAVRREVRLEGGAMGSLAGARMNGEFLSIEELVRRAKAWALNGEVAEGHRMPPLLTFRRGQSVVLEIVNDTAFAHPMHIHGHSFRVLSANGRALPHGIWQDTVVVNRRERVEVAFVADNPGGWMFHCHILEHQAAGMMGVVQVT